MGSRSTNMASCLTASRPSLLHLAASAEHLDSMDHDDDARYQTTTPLNDDEPAAASNNSLPSDPIAGGGGMVSPENPPSTPEKQTTAVTTRSDKTACTFRQLEQRYSKELDYMLPEFRKLEKQLLGAKAATRETAGSKERREKLHSFIVHLDETIQQIQAGCRDGDVNDTTVVQQLEEHILTNLLPVKVRLKKQLAAQQGAKHNPATMPMTRGTTSAVGAATAAADKESKATFVPVHKPPAAADSHFGKPLAGGGSSLTQKLHGPTLGSTKSTKPKPSNKVLYAGMAIGSEQIESSVHAANSVHQFVIHDPALLELQKMQQQQDDDDFFADTNNPELILSDKLLDAAPPSTSPATNEALEQMRLRLLRRKKRKRQKKRELRREQQKLQAEPAAKKRKPTTTTCPKKRGPRAVEYICALCNESYPSSCEFNTWWALSQQECPKCRKGQVRICCCRGVYFCISKGPAVAHTPFSF